MGLEQFYQDSLLRKNKDLNHSVWEKVRKARTPEEIRYFGSPLSSRMDGKNLDKYLGCLVDEARKEAGKILKQRTMVGNGVNHE